MLCAAESLKLRQLGEWQRRACCCRFKEKYERKPSNQLSKRLVVGHKEICLLLGEWLLLLQ